MAIYNDKFKGFSSTPTSDDLIDFANAIIANTMRNLHVATMGVITDITKEGPFVKVLPTNEGEDEKVIKVYNLFEIAIKKGDIVLVLFTDKDFKQNLVQLLKEEKYLFKNTNKTLHSEQFGIIINNMTSDLSGYYTKGEIDEILTEYAKQTDLANYLPLSGGILTGDLTTKKLTVGDEGIEIYDNTTPYIDFHYQNSGVDYTARIIETPQGVIDIQGNFPYLTINGVNVATVNTYKPSKLGEATSANHKFIFNNVNKNGIAVFTFGNTTTFINLYNLTNDVIYKQNGTFVYDTGGSVVSTTINIRKNSSNQLEIWSGNSNFSMVNGYTGYLFIIEI